MNEEINLSINDAQLALSYAASKGVALNKDVIVIIVECKNEFISNQRIDNEREQKFWDAYSQLMLSIRPATIESIKYKVNGQKNITGSINIYRYLALATLIVMVTVQIYWVVGSGLISDYRKIPTEIDGLQSSIDDRSDILGSKSAEDNDILTMESKIINLRTQLITNSKSVGVWNVIWKAPLTLNDKLPPNIDTEDIVISEYRSAIFVLQAIETYILPLLYGLLGAFAYVLRNIAIDTKEGYYTKQSNLNYVLRLHLGALAGLAIGWFIGPSTASNEQDLVRGLSPLALAFLGGYSVEILFSLMDRIIGSVSKT